MGTPDLLNNRGFYLTTAGGSLSKCVKKGCQKLTSWPSHLATGMLPSRIFFDHAVSLLNAAPSQRNDGQSWVWGARLAEAGGKRSGHYYRRRVSEDAGTLFFWGEGEGVCSPSAPSPIAQPTYPFSSILLFQVSSPQYPISLLIFVPTVVWRAGIREVI